jgi:SPP1 gp7 family putative phage head morphogenesis protein
MKKRMGKLKRSIWEFVQGKDALGLKDRFQGGPGSAARLTGAFGNKVVGNDSHDDKPTTLATPQPREFEFRTDAGKIQAFRDWLEEQIRADVLSSSPNGEPGKPWTAKYIESSYKKGRVNAFAVSKAAENLFEGADFAGKTQENFIRTAFGQPETTRKLELLSTRSFEELKGITAAMSQQLNRTLANGLVEGQGAREIARSMMENVDGMTERRALVLARTEVIHAHAEGQLDSFTDLGVEEVGVEAEWSTAGDDRVCPQCEEMEGKTFSMEEAHGMIPLHPNCVLGDQFVEFQNGLAVTRAKYFGRIVRIQTAKGRKLSVTENHILATRDGWMAAKDVRKGCQLIRTFGLDGSFSKTPNDDKGKSRISDVFRFLSEMLPENLRSIPSSRPEHFHGDGGSMKEQIDVILSDGKLWDSPDSSFEKKAKEFSFMGGHISFGKSQPLSSFGAFSQALHRSATSPYSVMGSGKIPSMLFGSSIFHHNAVGSPLVPKSDSGISQSDVDAPSSAAEKFGNLVNTCSSLVEFDDVIDIQLLEPRLSESGGGGIFVFDVWTHTLSYSLEGILSSNCRCTWTPHIPKSLLE